MLPDPSATAAGASTPPVEQARQDEAPPEPVVRGRAMRVEVERASERLAHLYRLTAALSRAATSEEIADAILEKGLVVTGALRGSVAVLSEDGRELRVLRARGYTAQTLAALDRFPVTAPLPLAEAVRTGRPLWLTAGDVLEQYPHLAPYLAETGTQRVAALPLSADGRTFGAIGLSFADPTPASDEDRAFTQALAGQCALTLERARLYEAERRARAQAEAAVRVREAFLAVAAHELKTPITSLWGVAQLLLRRLERQADTDPAVLGRSLRTIHRQSAKLVRLVNLLLDVSRLETGKLRLEPQMTDLVALVEEAVSAVGAAHAAAQAPAVRLRTPLPPARAEAVVDPLRIGQVVVNLLDNAIRYSRDGDDIQVDLGVGDNGSAQIAVRDHGLGVPPEHRPHLFERFYQAHADQHQSGLGMGLYISQQLVELHGGRLDVEFPDDGGSRFVVTLPLRPGARADERGAAT